jgi:hypothetical protein
MTIKSWRWPYGRARNSRMRRERSQITDTAETTAFTCLLIFCCKTRRNVVVTEITVYNGARNFVLSIQVTFLAPEVLRSLSKGLLFTAAPVHTSESQDWKELHNNRFTFRLWSSMLYRGVSLVVENVSEEISASFFKVEGHFYYVYLRSYKM